MHYSDPDYDKERKLLKRRGKRLLKAGSNVPQPTPAKVRVQHLRDLKKLLNMETDEWTQPNEMNVPPSTSRLNNISAGWNGEIGSR